MGEISETHFKMDSTDVVVTGFRDMTEDEVQKYVEYIKQKTKYPLIELVISPADDGQVELRWKLQSPKFERIRRITGYLVGTIDRWNNAKRTEEKERVKHV